ncbi:MAG: hypothetical protein ACOYYJ_10535 [Chloroflexota bacterium]
MSGSKREAVACLSDVEYADRPLSLAWEGQRLEIAEILARWRAPGEKGFRVQTADQQVFELTYRELPDEWEVTNLGRR